MYDYPGDCSKYTIPLSILSEEHTMGDSLERYLAMKIDPGIASKAVKEIVVRGRFVRGADRGAREKSGKMFNFMRPTLETGESTAYLNCYPGIDYVFHYANIVASYLRIKQVEKPVRIILPKEEECWRALEVSGLLNIPKVDTVIMGYVEGLGVLSFDEKWSSCGYFFWKKSIRCQPHHSFGLPAYILGRDCGQDCASAC